MFKFVVDCGFEFGNVVNCGVFGFVVVDCMNCSCFDIVGGVKVWFVCG